jgi:FkbM family methyltransferase
MTIERQMRRWMKNGILYAVRKLGRQQYDASLEGALQRLRQRDTSIQTVIDIGASDGRWSIVCRSYFPQAHYVLIEAQSLHESALQALKQHTPNLDYVIKAAGDREGEIYFWENSPTGGIASPQPFADHNIVVPMTSVDALVSEYNLQPPFLLKLDTHGAETMIFEGARQCLKQTAVIIVEVYNFNFAADTVRYPEMNLFLEQRGFRCVDLCDPIYRDLDGALWQMDLFFEPLSSPVFQSNKFKLE